MVIFSKQLFEGVSCTPTEGALHCVIVFLGNRKEGKRKKGKQKKSKLIKNKLIISGYYRFSQPRDHLQWRLVLGYYDKVKLLSKGLLAKLA